MRAAVQNQEEQLEKLEKQLAAVKMRSAVAAGTLQVGRYSQKSDHPVFGCASHLLPLLIVQ